MDFFSYFEDNESKAAEFTVLDVYMRTENNFLQGLYFDKDEREFYESAGLYRYSHIHKLAVQDPSTMSLDASVEKSEQPIILEPVQALR